MKSSADVTILLAEDDEGHARLIEKSLKRAGVNNPLIHVKDGGETVDFLFREGKYKGTPLPVPLLLLLDLNMPVLDGFAVLKRMKENTATSDIPVIVITSQDEISSYLSAREMGAFEYLIKPVDAFILKQMIESIYSRQ